MCDACDGHACCMVDGTNLVSFVPTAWWERVCGGLLLRGRVQDLLRGSREESGARNKSSGCNAAVRFGDATAEKGQRERYWRGW
jgi:hypothetical protein